MFDTVRLKEKSLITRAEDIPTSPKLPFMGLQDKVHLKVQTVLPVARNTGYCGSPSPKRSAVSHIYL